MEHVSVDRRKLIGIIEHNREKHIKAHDIALAGWKVKQVRELQKALVKARDGKAVQVMLHKPSSFSAEYDRVIGMLKMSITNHVDLTPSEYDQYVKDRWQWSNVFATSNSAYGGVGKAARMPKQRKGR